MIDKQYILDNLTIIVEKKDELFFEILHEINGIKGIMNLSSNVYDILTSISNNSKYLVGVIEQGFKDNEIEYELSYNDRFEIADYIFNEIVRQI